MRIKTGSSSVLVDATTMETGSLRGRKGTTTTGDLTVSIVLLFIVCNHWARS